MARKVKYVSSRHDCTEVLHANELAAKITTLEGMLEERNSFFEMLVDELKEGETLELHVRPHTVHLMKVPPK